METFASYGFNKAHSVAYALTSYYTAYLKTHYPAEFMAALLTAVMRQPERLAGYLSRCRERGPEVLPPSVNTSLGFFSAQKGRIVFGLDAVRGVGSAAAGEIVRARKDGPFRSLGDFLSRVSLRAVTKRAVSSLIRCGALDDTGESRESMLSRLDAAISRARLHPARGAGLLRFLPDYIPEGRRAGPRSRGQPQGREGHSRRLTFGTPPNQPERGSRPSRLPASLRAFLPAARREGQALRHDIRLP